MEYCKLQVGCMLIILYIAINDIWGRREYGLRQKEPIFHSMIAIGIISVLFDGLTAYTVNQLQVIPDWMNDLFHMCFLLSLDLIVFSMFVYVLDITRGIPKSRKKRGVLVSPLLINLAVVVAFIPELEYRTGVFTNYSMGISAYTCYIMVSIYMVSIWVLLVSGWRKMNRHKRFTIATIMAVAIFVTVYQMLRPEALLSSLVPTFAIMGTYLNMENPALYKLRQHNQEMIMGFANLVENRDGSTGGHIKRTTAYVRMLAEALQKRGYYQEELTRDFMKNLAMVAPMHDVGKICIPDAILQKPGKLTAEEFDIMKTHASRGGQILQETFGKSEDEDYEKLAYQVAMYHHEKWNGTGYPEGRKENEIPLSARIMAVADVFDAVSAKRCYRDALPLDVCFQIIEDGMGKDFDPVIAQTFLEIRPQIVAFYQQSK